jgi:D-serine deaminase-like pyridoxal phosphate-dependent protein
MLPLRMTERLEALAGEPVDVHDKVLHGIGDITLGDVGDLGWNIVRGDTPLPLLTADWEAVLSNVRRMQTYCDAHGCLFAPHGKTTMAPQVWAEQVGTGAWAITVADVRQLGVAVAFGVPRVLVANEVTAAHDLSALAAAGSTGESELFIFVDSVRGVSLLADELGRAEAPTLKVFVELGLPGGRCGVRTDDDVDDVLGAIGRASPALACVGVAGFEGIVDIADRPTVDRFVARLIDASKRIGSTSENPVLVSAGGSIFFDRVVDGILDADLPDTRLVLRSGAYVTHDDGVYASNSPFTGTDAFEAALELWSSVLSRPEPGRAVLGLGRRDAPFDAGLPAVRRIVSGGEPPVVAGEDYVVAKLNDQHAYLDVPPDAVIQPGDLVGCGVSHPCSAFDRWRTVLTVNRELDVTGAVRTFF